MVVWGVCVCEVCVLCGVVPVGVVVLFGVASSVVLCCVVLGGGGKEGSHELCHAAAWRL